MSGEVNRTEEEIINPSSKYPMFGRIYVNI